MDSPNPQSEIRNPQPDRDTTLDRAFRDALPRAPIADVTVGTHKLRRFSLGTIDLCRDLGLTLFTDPAASESLTPADLTRQLTIYLWMQSAPLETEVFPSVDDGTWKAKVRSFAFTVDMDALAPVLQSIQRTTVATVAAAVEVAAKPAAESPDPEGTPPPNS